MSIVRRHRLCPFGSVRLVVPRVASSFSADARRNRTAEIVTGHPQHRNGSVWETSDPVQETWDIDKSVSKCRFPRFRRLATHC